MTLKATLILLALGATWGASFLFIKVLVDETSPLEVAEGRLLFGTLAVGAVIAVRRPRVRWRPSLLLRVTAWSLVALVAPFVLIAWAEQHIASGQASVLNSTMPLFTAMFAAIFLVEEQLTAGRLAGLVAGFLGVVVLTGGKIYDFRDSFVLGQLAVVGAAACFGLGAVYARNLLRHEDPLGLSGGQLAMGMLITLPVLLAVQGTPNFALSLEAWLSLLTLGIVSTGIGIVVYMWLLDNIGSVRGSLVTYIVPVVGLLLGWAILNESIGVNTLLGAFLIIAGVGAVMRGQAPTSRRLPVSAESVAAD